MWKFLVPIVYIWVWNLSFVHSTTDQTDVSALKNLYDGLYSPSHLTGWSSTGDDPCGQSWKGITCSRSAVTEIKLSGLGLSGSMGYQLSSLTSLTNLDLSDNNITNDIPYQLPPNVQTINLGGNALTGGIPYSISQMTSLKYLNISHNQLQGQLIDMFGQLPSLSSLDLSFNNLTGNLPESFSSLSSMTTMYLQNNQLTGPIDALADLPLQNLNVANNHFSGWIPDHVRKINNIHIDGNSWTLGPAPPPPPPYTPPPIPKSNPAHKASGNNSPSNGGEGKKFGLRVVAIAGIIIPLLIISGVVALFLLRRRQRGPSYEEKLEQGQYFAPLGSTEPKELKSIQSSSSIETKTLQPTASMTLKPPPIERPKSFDEDDCANKVVMKRVNTAPINAMIYSVADLQISTGSFSVDNLIGEGSIGCVYRAQFSDGKVFAVKKINSSALPNQASEDFLEVVSNISQLHHPNVTELVGYCSEHGQHLLVYEFVKNGSLHDFLHLSDEFSKPLTWSTRVNIALGAARALEYLHKVCSPSIVHKNFKSANILLDMELNPHLADCGLASFVPDADHQSSNQNTASGYAAPEVAMSGQYTLKSDVYSFGVVMLELLTGRKPFDSSLVRLEQSLVRWATPQLHDIDALTKMVDPELNGLYPVKSLSRFADVVALCVQPEPEFRPPMSEVLQALVQLVKRTNMSKRTTSFDNRRAEDRDNQDNTF